MEDLHHWLALASVPGMDVRRYRQICQSVPLDQFFASSSSSLRQLGLTPCQSQMLLNPQHQHIAAAANWLQQAPNRYFIRCIDPEYPELLLQTKQPPLALFVEGDATLLQQPQLAIVGSRQPTATGKQIAWSFAADLTRQGLAITSGLAGGIDGAAHQGALSAGGKTIAVLGNGLAHIYPKQHRALTADIVAHGVLVSEYLPHIEPRPMFFPLRNRIVAGLSLGTLVVEAAVKSGSLISAHYAAEYSREVFAVPGSVLNPLAAGCHQLIQQGAKLTTCVADIVEELAMPDRPGLLSRRSAKNNLQQDLFEHSLLANVGDEATAIDVIAARAQLSVADVSIALLQLELAGEVAVVPGGYIRVRRA